MLRSGLPGGGAAYDLFADLRPPQPDYDPPLGGGGIGGHRDDVAPALATDVSAPLSVALDVAMVLANILPISVVVTRRRGGGAASCAAVAAGSALDELVVALSVTDVLSVLVPSPLGLYAHVTRSWHGGAATCHFYQLTALWFPLASMCLVTLMCVERWLALRAALMYQVSSSPRHPRRVRVSVAAVYGLSLLVACLPLWGLAPPALSSPHGGTGAARCRAWLTAVPRHTQQHVFYFVFLVLGYLNIITAVLVNASIILSLWQFQRKFGGGGAGCKPVTAERLSGTGVGGPGGGVLQMDRRNVWEFTVMILCVTILFYLTWMPALAMVTLQKAGVAVPPEAVLYALLSTSLTGLLNPLIYATFSRGYRRGYRRVLAAAAHRVADACCWCCGGRASGRQRTTTHSDSLCSGDVGGSKPHTNGVCHMEGAAETCRAAGAGSHSSVTAGLLGACSSSSQAGAPEDVHHHDPGGGGGGEDDEEAGALLHGELTTPTFVRVAARRANEKCGGGSSLSLISEEESACSDDEEDLEESETEEEVEEEERRYHQHHHFEHPLHDDDFDEDGEEDETDDESVGQCVVEVGEGDEDEVHRQRELRGHLESNF